MKTLRALLLLLVLASLACGQSVTPAVPAPTSAPASVVPPMETAGPLPTLTEIPATVTVPVPTAVPAGALAREHMAAITGQIGARFSGTPEEARTAQYIQDAFRSMGYEPVTQPFRRSGWTEDEDEIMVESANVYVVKPGESGRILVVGAHYDSSTAALGADDNASGVGVMLELAQTLEAVRTPYSIIFIAFGGEEAGLLGSQYFVDQLGADLKNVAGFINLDSIAAGDITYIYSFERRSSLRDWLLDWGVANGTPFETIHKVDLYDEEGYATADFGPFQAVRIPFAYFESTDWTMGARDGYTQVDPKFGEMGAIIHTSFDRLDYFDQTFPGRVDEHLKNIVNALQALLTQYQEPG